ncbi:MAG: helix-turn-helix domain-containing protein [Saprospiraceae bacterium]
MSNSNKIPTLEIKKLDKFHFPDVEWRFYKQHHLFHINRLEDYRPRLSFPLPPHRKTVYDLIFLTQGESIRSKGLNQYKFSENQFFFLPALQLTEHITMSENVKGYFVHFSPTLFSDNISLLNSFQFLNFNTNPIVSIPNHQTKPILNIFERLLEIYQKDESKAASILVWYLMVLLSEVNQNVGKQNVNLKNSAAELTQRFKDVLTQQIYSYHTIKEFAQLLHVSPNHLNKCVKHTLDKTAQSLLNEMLIMEAKSLLKYSNLNISEIAEKLYGSTPSNFARFFKKQTGYSPRDFINQ